ncbi:serpentine type 7TM GPCR chemoreceptor srsx domain-containing protein [Ditylenchus destructor]|uniref:Serpentine type 7TM GPCR chemoreceptor srsx domain-containing protein n=1 Tax=Ditylenchus destructor TaxID=166010 RepID=A0AAD4NCM4_9BILA|nr:serpentine type 7TM GPCR chemoreceptor srsx domain-containing protein [Ditylenchus destructor]
MHTRCHVLIGLLAITDMVVCFYYSTLRIFIFMNMYNMTNSECFMRGIYGLFAMNAQAGLTLALALDRLFAIVKPASYRNWQAKSYLSFICAPATLYAIPMTMYGYFSSSRDLSLFLRSPTVQKTIELWLVWPVIINSSSNVIIYWWRSKEFRKAFVRILFANDVEILKRSTVWSKGSRRRTIAGSIKPLTVLPYSRFIHNEKDEFR